MKALILQRKKFMKVSLQQKKKIMIVALTECQLLWSMRLSSNYLDLMTLDWSWIKEGNLSYVGK